MHEYLRLTVSVGIAILTFMGTANADTVLNISPPSPTVAPGSTFTVDVDITGVTDLYGYQFDLSFNPSVLAAVSSSEGSFLSSGGATFFIPGTNDNVGGTVSATANTLLTAISGVNGSGTLAIFTFTALKAGTSAISIQNETLLDSNLNVISDTTSGGTVTVSVAPVPLPASLWVLVSGLGGLAVLARKRIAA